MGSAERSEPHNNPLFVLASPFTPLSTRDVPCTDNAVRYVIFVRFGLQLSLHCTFVLGLDMLQGSVY
jgi:hypothetical protein